ncbi:MAG: hypothetical protein OEY56_05760 [Cyclobacteriaceae bacterium]|nr:hypothetical protein [Cyclobacteriaceae bacterium]
MFSSRFFKTYLLPGFIFQSITIGGGYGTGRELVEFFLKESPLGGLMGMILAMAIWSVVLAISFELARMSRTYDYRSFIRSLLGPGWLAYEAVYLIGLVLVISVLGSAAGELVRSMFGLAPIFGIVCMMLLVGLLAFFGSTLIEKVLSFWSIALYLVFFFLISASLWVFGDDILTNIRIYSTHSTWAMSGIRYAAYNIGILPAMIFVVRHLNTRREALLSGTLAGALTMIPGFFVYFAMTGSYPAILNEPVPTDFLALRLGIPAFTVILRIILFGTFIETGVGLIHGFNERIAGVYLERQKTMPPALRAGIALVVLAISVFVADAIGIVALIARGYGALTWGYMACFVLPVLTVGSWKMWQNKAAKR